MGVPGKDHNSSCSKMSRAGAELVNNILAESVVENYTRGDLNNVDVSGGGGTTGLQADLHHPALLYLFVLFSSKWAKTDIDI